MSTENVIAVILGSSRGTRLFPLTRDRAKPKSIAKRTVSAYFFDGYREDIGTIRSFYAANIALTDVSPEFNFYDAQVPIGIGEKCLIQNAIIDKNARIGDNAVIANTKNLDNYDADNYYIRDRIVIVPKDATIPSDTVI